MPSPNGCAAHGIDAHGHGVPAPFLDAVQRSGLGGVTVDRVDGKYVLTFPGQKPLRPMAPRMVDFQQRLEWLDQEQLAHQVLGTWLDVQGQELPAAAGQEWTRQLNDALAQSIAPWRDRLHAYATLHLEEPKAAARELERSVRDLGMLGCMLPTSTPTRNLEEPEFDALWEAAVSLDVAVILHPPTAGPANCIPGMDRFAGLYGRLIDTTMAAAKLLLAGLFDRFPELRVILVHGGGMLPYQTGRLTNMMRNTTSAQPLAVAPAEYVKRYFYDTTLMDAHAVSMLVRVAGADHVLLGSDYPFSVGAPPLMHALTQSGVDADAVAAVTAGTAERVFNMQKVLQ